MRRHLIVVGILSAAALSFACSARAVPLTPAPASPAVTSTPGPEVLGYDPAVTMSYLYSGKVHPPQFTLGALGDARIHGDASQVSVILELVPFLHGTPEFETKALRTMRALTGQDSGDTWEAWMEWLGRHIELFPAPEGYLEWKRSVYSSVDPRYGDLLPSVGDDARVERQQVLWGRDPPGRYPSPGTGADHLSRPGRVSACSGPGIRGLHQRRAQGIPLARRQPPRDGERCPWGRAYHADLLHAVRERNRVFRNRQRRAHHVWVNGALIPRQQVMYDRATGRGVRKACHQSFWTPTAGPGV